MNPKWWRICALGGGLVAVAVWFFWPRATGGPQAEEFVGTWTGPPGGPASLSLTADGRFEMFEMPAAWIAPLESDRGPSLVYPGWGYWRIEQAEYWLIVFDIEDGPPIQMDAMQAFIWREADGYRLCFPHGQNKNSAECALFERQP